MSCFNYQVQNLFPSSISDKGAENFEVGMTNGSEFLWGVFKFIISLYFSNGVSPHAPKHFFLPKKKCSKKLLFVGGLLSHMQL